MGSSSDIHMGVATVSSNTWTSDVFRDQIRLLWAHVEYTADATVGNRWISLELLDSSGTVMVDTHSGAAQTAGQVRDHEFFPGIFRETSYINNHSINVPIPAKLIIPANHRLKILDDTNVSTGDSMVIHYQYEEV
jgi:hypothetical protein